MKIFISWSGKPSQNIALALKEWLPLLFTGIEPFVSSENVRKGKRWQIEISKELETSNYGIICLTPENTEAPWILFESGALSKSMKESSLSTLLTGGLRNGDIEGPLSHFQHTSFEKEDFFKLITSINDAQENGKQDAIRLRKIFDKFWDELVAAIDKSIKTTEKAEKRRSPDDMMREILDVVTSIAKSMPQEANIVARVDEAIDASMSPLELTTRSEHKPDYSRVVNAFWKKMLKSANSTIIKYLKDATVELHDNILFVYFSTLSQREWFSQNSTAQKFMSVVKFEGSKVGIQIDEARYKLKVHKLRFNTNKLKSLSNLF